MMFQHNVEQPSSSYLAQQQQLLPQTLENNILFHSTANGINNTPHQHTSDGRPKEAPFNQLSMLLKLDKFCHLDKIERPQRENHFSSVIPTEYSNALFQHRKPTDQGQIRVSQGVDFMPFMYNVLGSLVGAGTDAAVVGQNSAIESLKSTDLPKRSSKYRGVTRHKWSSKFEAHLWDKNDKKLGRVKKGRQVYLGGYEKEEDAAKAYDLASIKYWGTTKPTNFPLSTYKEELKTIKDMSRLEVLSYIRRNSNGFNRGASKYRGVTKHHLHNKWQARIGRTGQKDMYLGTFKTEEEAAAEYDKAAIRLRGVNAVTNFEMSKYDLRSILGTTVPRELVTHSQVTQPLYSNQIIPNCHYNQGFNLDSSIIQNQVANLLINNSYNWFQPSSQQYNSSSDIPLNPNGSSLYGNRYVPPTSEDTLIPPRDQTCFYGGEYGLPIAYAVDDHSVDEGIVGTEQLQESCDSYYNYSYNTVQYVEQTLKKWCIRQSGSGTNEN